jgi:hypothetical protein
MTDPKQPVGSAASAAPSQESPATKGADMSYDPKCEELARHFLPDGTSDNTVQRVAQRIQDTVEDEIQDAIDDIKVRPE